ncbi:outer membrane immunogenic protein [Neorhizobium huautlense]|uniref:Outer membrane immunogenic protein n=1 Tax=Neorhizobium huautlense TaxID=67774 RepID=A0ABT9PYQ6_9HYPH|nr:outer membrane protein [Neorhizobium huautlense]MDP9839620.1 outer membrane immunogenic protein [Neorhizobium huautlense]
MFKKSLVLALGAAFVSGPVFAADLTNAYEAPSYNEPVEQSSGWTGGYVGLHAGTASRHGNPFSGNREFMGGVQGGYNMETNGFVVGGELELSHMGDARVRVPGGELEERYRLAAKAKAGMPLGDTLVYGTAGGTMTSMRDASAQGPDGWKPGWLVGAGVEHKFNQQISGKVEYNYARTGDVRSVIPGVGAAETDVSDHTIKAGVNYHF